MAASTAVIPLVLHMMQRRRIVRIPFSTIRFLKLAEKRSSRRIRLENFLLWLLRTLLMVFISLAFAMPMLRTKAFGNFLSRSERDVAIVLDASYSMDYSTGKDTVWNKAIQSAVAIINGLNDGDRVCVFLANDDVQPVVEQLSGDKEFAIAQVKGLVASKTSSQLASAVVAAYGSLTEETRRREREVHIITDGQALPWSGFKRTESGETNRDAGSEQAAGEDKEDEDSEQDTEQAPRSVSLDLWQPAKVDKRTAFFITLEGVPEPANAAPTDIGLLPQLIMADMPSKVTVKLGHCGPAQNTSVSVHIDDEEIARRALVLGEGGYGDVTFALPVLEPGMHTGRIETPLDNLPVDNTFHFLIRVRQSLPTLCVGSKDSTLYLMKAMNPGASIVSPLDVKWIVGDDIANENLGAYSCVILCDALPLPGQGIVQVEEYVRRGGLLVLFPGNRAIVGDYEPWSCLPGKVLSIKDVPMSARKKTLRWEKPQHELLRTLNVGPGGVPVVTIRRELRWEKLHDSTEQLISAGVETPFLVSHGFGDGCVLFFAISADRSWSSFPLSPFYLPLAHQIVQYGAGIMGDTPCIWAARSLSLTEHVPTATAESALLDPAGNEVSVRSSLIDNKTLLRAEDLLMPGIYALEGSDGDDPDPVMAINIDRTESDLTPLKMADIPELIGVKDVNVARGKSDLLRLIDEHRVGRTLGEPMLWLVFIVAMVEVFYANQKTKSTPPLSEILEIEASGKVS